VIDVRDNGKIADIVDGGGGHGARNTIARTRSEALLRTGRYGDQGPIAKDFEALK
jgi:hypothetical protein